MAFTAQNSSQTGLCNVKVELYGFSTIHHNCRSKPKPQVQLDPLGPLRFKLRSKAVVEYRSNHNLRLIAEGLDAAFESSHRSAHCVEAGSYHHERRARRCADGHADALPRCGVCRLAGNAGPASAAQQKIEAATSAYNDARTKLDDLQKQIDSNEASIEEIEAKLPEQQAKASSAMRDLYKYQKGTNPIVSFLVNAQSLGEFITTCKYTNQITSCLL